MPSAITLEALIVIDAIDKRGSFASAAEALDKVPSALSYIVQKLEEQLEVTLFQKQGRRSVLTPAGKHLLNEGRRLLHATEQLEIKTKSIASGWEPKIRIAIESMLNTNKTFEIIESFLRDHPRIEIDIREEVMSGAWEALIDDQVDLLLGGPTPVPQQKGLSAVSIGQLDLVFVVGRDHPLASRKQPITRAELSEFRAVVMHDSARVAIPWSKGLLSDRNYFYVPTIDCKVRAQLAGIGFGNLPRSQAKAYLEDGSLVELALDEPNQANRTEMYIASKIVSRGKGLQALKSMFIDAFSGDPRV